MKIGKFYLIAVLSILSYGEARIKYLEKDANIEFIGKQKGYQRITVPKEIIEYEPTLININNTILYDDRVITKEECIIDQYNHEYCPIDKEECPDSYDVVQGTSERHEVTKVSDPYCQDGDTETIIHEATENLTYLECSKDTDGNYLPDTASESSPFVGDFEAIDTVSGEGLWDTNIIPGAVVQRNNPDSPTFFVYSPTTVERDNMVIEGDLSMNTDLAKQNKGDDDWIGFVFGFKDQNNYHYLSWRRNSTIGNADGSNKWTGFTMGRVVNGTLPWNHENSTANTILQRNTSPDVYGWENRENYRVKIVYNPFFIKAYIAKYNTDGSVGTFMQIINYNPEEEMDIKGRMGFMNHSNGGAIYKNFRASYCPIGYAVDGEDYVCKREPECAAYYEKVRISDVGIIRCEMSYAYYDYLCPNEPNIYDMNYIPTNPGGDCGHVKCTNEEAPPANNCKRLKYSCPADPSKPCVVEEKTMDYNDFTKWEVENYRGVPEQDCPTYGSGNVWEVDEVKKNSVFQKCNGQPTYFLSNYQFTGGTLTMEGTFRTDDPGDNDYFGFVFGYQNTANHYILSWSRWKNDTWRLNHASSDPFEEPLIGGEIPLILARVTNYDGGNWYRNELPGKWVPLQSYNNGGWSTGIDYNIKIQMSPDNIKVWIGKVGEPLHLDIDYYPAAPLNVAGKLGFFNYSISRVTYKDFRISWTDNNVEQTTKRLLGAPTVSGEYKGLEYGNIRGFECENNCRYSLSKMYAKDGHTLCLVDRQGSEGCMNFSEDCVLEGKIEEVLPYSDALFSFLNAPGEDVPAFNGYIAEEVGDSPTGISLRFIEDASSVYPLGKLDHPVVDGDKRTVDFWMKWDGVSEGSVFSFGDYGLWMSSIDQGEYVFGYNDIDGNIFGISAEGLESGWHRVTAVFTQGSIEGNKIFIDGVERPLQNYIIRGMATFDGMHEYTSRLEKNEWKLGIWGRNDYFPVDTDAVYTMSGTLEVSGYQSGSYDSVIPRQYLGIRNYDADHRVISSVQYLRYKGAKDTRLSRDLNPGDTKMYLHDATGWDNGPGLWYNGCQNSHRFLWYGYTNSQGYTYPDYTYTRNNSGCATWPEGGIKNLGGEWEITLREGWWGPKISSGTAVRNNKSGRSDTWALYQWANLSDGVYSNTHIFGGGVAEPDDNSNETFMPGTVYVKPLVLMNHVGEPTNELLAPAPTVTVKDVYMTNNQSGTVTRKNLASNMRQPMHLSGSGEGADGMFTGSVAGINIYAGELSAGTVTRMHNKGSFNGITYIKVNQNSIDGYDASNEHLGSITSTCSLSGKVGDFGFTQEEEVTTTTTIATHGYHMSSGDDHLAIPNSSAVDLVGRSSFAIYLKVKLVSAPTTAQDIIYNKEEQYELAVDPSGKIYYAMMTSSRWDWVATDLYLPIGGEPTDVIFNYDGAKVEIYAGDDYWSHARTGVISQTSQNKYADAPLKIGDRTNVPGAYTPEIIVEDFRLWHNALTQEEIGLTLQEGLVLRGIAAHYDFEEINPLASKHGDAPDIVNVGGAIYVETSSETVTRTDYVERVISYPITSAKAINNRIEFWDGFTRGAVGHIEPLKYVEPSDYSEGFRHEFGDLVKLYELGFTGFTTADNNITYAISNEPMQIGECLEHIQDTQYFLSDRNLSDEAEMSTLRMLSPYAGGEQGDYCVIEKNGGWANGFAKYAIRTIIKEGIYLSYVCSQWSCESHMCGVASCKEGFQGTIIKKQDKPLVLNSDICIAQDCDVNYDYFAVCGNYGGCDISPDVYQKENGSCVKATCADNGVLNTETAMCEKYGCKDSIEAGDGTCYKQY